MEIPNLSSETISVQNSTKIPLFSLPTILLILLLSLGAGFGLSRFISVNPSSKSISVSTSSETALSTDNISTADQLVVGKIYGNLDQTFKDTAIGTIEKGNINGEGTHILIREGGLSQRASLISSTVDLDLFVNKKVEVKGETNASNKTAWLLDVGSVKILE